MGARIHTLVGAALAACLVVPMAGSAVASAGSTSAAGSLSPAVSAGAAVSGERGTWRVEESGDSRYVVSWTSPSRLPLTSDRPLITGAGDAVIDVPALSADGRTLTSVVTASARPDPRRLDVVLSGRLLDQRSQPPALRSRGASGSSRASELPTQTLPDDPGAQGPFAVVSSDYTLNPVKLPGMREPIEMVGHVVEPAAAEVTGPRPLVLFMHGRHSVCYSPPGAEQGSEEWPCKSPAKEIPSHLGYDYIQQRLASQGYATVSVRVNGINAQDYALADGGAGARASIVVKHLQHWTTIAAAHQVDLSQVVLVGHSRGGEGVNRASIRIPLTAPYQIVGQILLAPTDFGLQTAPYVPTVTVLPYCDGDVSDLQGQKFTDISRDLTTDDTSLKSSVLVMGANHNFFNTEWTPGTAVAPSFDDWGGIPTAACGRKSADRLSAAGQRRVGRTYVAGAVRLFTGEGQYLPLYDGTAATVDSVEGADVRSHAIGGGRETRRITSGTVLTLPQGADAQFCSGVTNFEQKIGQCGRGIQDSITPHWATSGERIPVRRFFEMSWTAIGQRAGLSFDTPLDVSAGRLELRTIVDAARGDAKLDVRLTDADGASVDLTPEGGGLVPALLRASYATKLWAQSVVVDTSGAVGVDLTRIVGVELLTRSKRGRVWVADVSSAPSALAVVPARRMPTLNLSTLKIPEGDSPASRVARLPFTVTGDVTRPMRVEVVTAGQERGSVQSFSIDLAPGQTSGSVPIAFSADDRDDYDVAVTGASIWATRNIMTDAYAGQLKVVDDDPTPLITLTPTKKTVREGENAEFVIKLAAATDYDLYGNARVKFSPHGLKANDVPASWLERYGPTDQPSATLAKLRISIYAYARAGERRLSVSIPISKDTYAEGRESLRLSFRIKGKKFTRTIFIARSAGGPEPVAAG